MRLLGRKKTEEEDLEDELDEEPRKVKPKSKDFKDLNPKNRKKRKEPKKPWGKKERLFVLLVLASTVGVSSFMAISSREWKIGSLPRISFPKLALPDIQLFGSETIVLEGNKENGGINEIESEISQDVIRKFKDQTKNLTGVYGLYIVNLESGFSYGVNENEVFQAASLIKLPVIAGMFVEAESGEWKMENKYILKNSDKVAGSGSLYGKPAGYELTYRDLVRLMGKESDNTAFNICRNLLGDKKVEEISESIGMTNTSLANNETTPKDIGLYFQKLWSNEIVVKKSRDEIVGFLTDTIYENHLAAGIPETVKVAHKYGREVHVVNDAGIVFSDKPFVIVIMSKGVLDKEADKVFPVLAKLIYDTISSKSSI